LGLSDGAKRWRVAYRAGRSQKLLAIGVYPEVGLKDAREECEIARKVLGDGGDPMAVKKQAKAEQSIACANTFKAIAAELVKKKRDENKADRTLSMTKWLLSLAHPEIGARPIKHITAPDILRVLRAVAARGRFETAKRLRATIVQVFRYAIATGRADTDPTGALRGAIPSPPATHRAAIVDPKGLGALLRAISKYEGAPETQLPSSWWPHGPRLARQPVIIWWPLYGGLIINWPFGRGLVRSAKVGGDDVR
jgi:hypothetical protein